LPQRLGEILVIRGHTRINRDGVTNQFRRIGGAVRLQPDNAQEMQRIGMRRTIREDPVADNGSLLKLPSAEMRDGGLEQPGDREGIGAGKVGHERRVKNLSQKRKDCPRSTRRAGRENCTGEAPMSRAVATSSWYGRDANTVRYFQFAES
jgi:hypothetical protein